MEPKCSLAEKYDFLLHYLQVLTTVIIIIVTSMAMIMVPVNSLYLENTELVL